MRRPALGLVVFVLSGAVAGAVTLTNRDERDHKITIIEGDSKTDHVLMPSQLLEGICPRGCTIRLNDSEDDEYELEALDVVSIEDGYLYYDAPEAPEPSQPGTQTPPAKK